MRGTSGVYKGVGPPSERRQLEVVAIAGDDVEGPPGTEFDRGGERPIAEKLSREAAAAEFAGLVDAAEDKAVTLIKERRRTIEARYIAVLRGKSGLQIGGIVDGVRPGVGGQKFVVLGEALAEIGAESVIDRTAVGVVGVHVAEGDAAGVGEAVGRGGIAGLVEPRQGSKNSLRLRHARARAS